MLDVRIVLLQAYHQRIQHQIGMVLETMIVVTATLAEVCLAHLMQTVKAATDMMTGLGIRDLITVRLLRRLKARMVLLIDSGDRIQPLVAAMRRILVPDSAAVIDLDYPAGRKPTDDILECYE